MIQPISIGYLIGHFDSPSTTDLYTATMAAIALLVSTLLCTIGMHQYMLGQVEIGFKIRVAVTTIIYSKVFNLPVSWKYKQMKLESINKIDH